MLSEKKGRASVGVDMPWPKVSGETKHEVSSILGMDLEVT